MSKKLFFFGMAVLVIALIAVISCDRNSPLDTTPELDIAKSSGATENPAVEDPQGREPPTVSSAATWPQSMSDFKWPVVSGQKVYIYAGYGPGGGSKYHVNADWHAVDLHNGDCPSATRWMWVTNPARGVVMQIGTNPNSSYGYYVKMNHHNGWISMVCHLQTNPSSFVAVGNDLLQGTFLGYTGSTGWTTGPHIHFVIRRNGVSQPLSGIDGDVNIVRYGTYTSSNVYVRPPFGSP